jgi:hypothetical protein
MVYRVTLERHNGKWSQFEIVSPDLVLAMHYLSETYRLDDIANIHIVACDP